MKEPVFDDSPRVQPLAENPPEIVTPMEQRFTHKYLQTLSLAEAARAIGITGNEASRAGWRIMARPRVRAYVEQLMRERNYAEGYNTERVLLEYSALGFSNILDYCSLGLDGEPHLDWAKIQANPRLGAAIAEIITETKTYGDPMDGGYEMTRTKFKLHSKLGALDSIAKILKLIDNKLTIQNPDGSNLVPTAGLTDREIARRVAFVLTLGMRQREAITVDQPKAEDFSDLAG